jgi:predicted nucleic acid-binding protein
MNDKIFVDTNILIYAHDKDAGLKHDRAKQILQELWTVRIGALSTQVLQEFYVSATKKISKPLSKATARLIVESYMPWCIQVTPDEIVAAFRIEDSTKISFWDALIVSAAIKCGAAKIISEDLNAGQKISGIRIENPFIASTKG